MNASAAARQEPQGSQAASGPRPLSCTNCRQRKIKCNKTNPCDPCQRSGIQCVSPSRRVRAPQRRHRGLEARDAELLRRIRRLESLVSKADTANAITNSGEEAPRPNVSNPTLAPTPSLTKDAFDEGAQTSVRLDDQYASFIKQQGSGTRYLSGDFWTSLGDEFDGLRQLLEHPVENDEDEFDDSMSNSTETTDSSPNFILKDSNSLVGLEASYPSDPHRSILFQFYFANVDPLCRILHRPTVTAHLSGSEELFDHSTGRFKFSSLEAITFAIYFAAVTSMSSQDCMTHFSEEKDVLVAQYKRSTETALAQADFLNSMEIITLQAFTLYTMVIRSHNKTRSSWALIGLAVRIAHGLGLHRDGDGRAFSAFEAEMRRRLWWQILVLDMRASEDRGSEPVILESSFNTKMPCNLNDEDFGQGSQHPLPDKKGVTEMTFSLISMDVSNTGLKINFIPPTSERQALTLEQKKGLVKECTDRIESHYLAGCDPSHQSTWLVCMMGRLLILKLWLVIQYPLQSRKSAPQEYPRGESLRTVVAFLTIAELIEENDSAAGFAWFFKTYVPWHALAVALAELCTETQGPLADRAWSIINKGYEKWSDRVADTKEGMLWRPVKSLLKRARAARQRDQKPVEAGAASEPAVLDSVLRNYDVASGLPNFSLEGSRSNSYSPMAFEDLGLISQATDPPLELDLFAPIDMALMSAEPSSGPINWDNWNEFIFDVGAIGVDIPLSLSEEWPMQM